MAERTDIKRLLTVQRCYVSVTVVRLMKIYLQGRLGTRRRKAACEHNNRVVMWNCCRLRALKCGSLHQRDIIFTDILSMLTLLGLFAGQGSIRATQETEKKCEQAQIYGTDMKEIGSLWYDFGERSVLGYDDELMRSLIFVFTVHYLSAWAHYAVCSSLVCRKSWVQHKL